MSAQGNLAGKARVGLNLDDSNLQKGLKAAQRQLRNFGVTLQYVGKDFAMVGGAITAPFALATKQFASVGDQLNKMSARTGTSVEMLSELSFAAQQSGTSVEDVEKSLRRLQKNTLDLERGLSTAVYAFKEIGLTTKDLQGLSPDQIFERVSAEIKKINDPTRRAAIAMELFGKSGSALLPMIDNMTDLREEAQRLGVTMTTEQAKAAADLTDAFGRMTKSVEALSISVGGALAPTIEAVSRYILKNIATIKKFIDENKNLTVAITGVGLSFTALGGALYVFGGILNGVSAIIGIYSKVVQLAIVRNAAYAAGIKLFAAANYILSKSFVVLGASMKAAFVHLALMYATYKAGRKLGEVIGETADKLSELGDKASGINKVMQKAFDLIPVIAFRKQIKNILDIYYEMTGQVEKIKELTQQDIIKKMYDDGRISFEEYARRITALGGVDMVPDAFADSGSGGGGGNEKAAAISEDVAEKNFETQKLALQLVYKEFELKSKMLELEKQEEIRKAGNNKEMIAAINAQYAIRERINAAEERAAKAAMDKIEKEKQAAEEMEKKSKLENINSLNKSREQTIAELQLEASFTGIAFEREKLKLAKARAIEEAKALGLNVELVEKEYKLREDILNAQEAASKVKTVSQTLTARGQFGGQAISRTFGMGGNTIEKSSLETAKNTRDLLKEFKSKNTLAFT